MTSGDSATTGAERPPPGAAHALSADDVVRLQAEYHPLESAAAGASAESLALHLVHLKAYELAESLAEGRDVLDLGCNDGYGTLRVARRARSTVGVDVSPDAIAVARGRAAAAQARFELVDGSALPFPDESFDLVITFQVLEHVADAGAFLREARRVLRRGGTLLLTTPNARLRLDPGMRPWNPFHVRERDAVELESELRTWFDEVSVRGLEASEPLRGIELRRVTSAREAARREAARGPAGRLLRRVVRALRERLPRLVASALRPVSPAAVPPPSLSLDDLRWTDRDLDVALDLLATCRRG